MSHFAIICISLINIFSATYALNLSLSDYHNPTANHILDAEVVGDILIISAMVQGIEFYDVSIPENLNHLTNFTLSNGGGWGGGIKSNCVRASGNYAYFTSSSGLYVVNISNPSNPQNLGVISGTNNFILENLDLNDNTLAICAHSDGVRLYDISDLSSPNYASTINVENAWATVITASIIYIASNNEIIIADIENINEPIHIDVIETENAIKDLATSNGFLYAALGTEGVNIYDINIPQNPEYLGNYNTTNLANRISPFDNKLAVSDWDDVEVLQWNGESLILVGYKNTGNRTMAIATKQKYIYSAEWASIQAFEFGEIEGPDIDLSTWELNYPFVENGNSFSLSLDIINNGNEILSTIDNYTTNSEFTVINPPLNS